MTTMTSASPSVAQTAWLQERVGVAREWLLVLDDLDLALEQFGLQEDRGRGTGRA